MSIKKPLDDEILFWLLIIMFGFFYIMFYATLAYLLYFTITSLALKYISTMLFIFFSIWLSGKQLPDVNMKNLFVASDKGKVFDTLVLIIKIAPIRVLLYILFILLAIIAQLSKIEVIHISSVQINEFLQINEFAIILVIAFDRVTSNWKVDKPYRYNLFIQYKEHIRGGNEKKPS